MSELARFEAALKAAGDAGDVQAATALAQEMRRMMQRDNPSLGMPVPVKLGQAGMPDAIKATIKDEFGVGAQRLAGGGSAPMIAGHAVAQLAGADNAADIENWKAVQSATPDTMGGNMVGNAAMFGALPAGAVGTGMAVAGRTLPRVGAVADMAATQGGIAAATTPGDAGERLTAALMGAGGGAAPAMVGAAQGARRMTTKAGHQLGLAESLRRELGPEAGALEKSLGGAYPGEAYGVRPSAAMLTRHPTLEVLETGSRVRTGDQWTQLDRMNAAARWKALEDAAGTPEELVKLRAARDAFTGPQREDALQATGGALKVGKGTAYGDLTEKLDDLATGTQRPNRDVQTLVSYVKGELEKGVSPEQLYTIRKVLTDGIAAGPTSELSQAARAARPQRMEIIGQLDSVLDDISGGKWSQYLENYKIASPQISSKTALQKITDALSSGRPAGEVPASMGEKAAPYTFGKLVERHGTKTFGSKEFDQLTPQHRRLVDSLLSDLNTQQGVMLPRATLGSPTAPFTANAGRVSQVTNSMVDAAGNVIPVLGGALSASVKGSMARKSEEALAELLKDPKALANVLRDAEGAQRLLERSGRVGSAGSASVRTKGE